MSESRPSHLARVLRQAGVGQGRGLRSSRSIARELGVSPETISRMLRPVEAQPVAPWPAELLRRVAHVVGVPASDLEQAAWADRDYLGVSVGDLSSRLDELLPTLSDADLSIVERKLREALAQRSQAVRDAPDAPADDHT